MRARCTFGRMKRSPSTNPIDSNHMGYVQQLNLARHCCAFRARNTFSNIVMVVLVFLLSIKPITINRGEKKHTLISNHNNAPPSDTFYVVCRPDLQPLCWSRIFGTRKQTITHPSRMSSTPHFVSNYAAARIAKRFAKRASPMDFPNSSR